MHKCNLTYVRATHSTGGMVTTTVVLAVGEALVRTYNKNLLDEEGDKESIMVSKVPLHSTMQSQMLMPECIFYSAYGSALRG